MTVTAVRKDPQALSLTVDTEFEATPERVWQLWSDPRQLERWWGPPTYPATFTSLDLRAGGRAAYYMTGPEGATPESFWEFLEVEPPHRLAFRDGFVESEHGSTGELPGPIEAFVTIERIEAGRTRMTIESRFPDLATMEQLAAMGMEQGLTQALGQIDAILAEPAATPA
jgi:uncharacterized protein YndB with AHSA1/START domain